MRKSFSNRLAKGLVLSVLGFVLVLLIVPPVHKGLAAIKGDKETSGAIKDSDKQFIVEAVGGGSVEVELGQLAKERGQSDLVKQFGQHMVDDHSKANAELSQLASRKGIALPAAEPTPAQKNVKDALMKLSGAAFDKQYMREMVKDHETDVAAFQKEAKQGKDADLVSWVKQALPMLQAHLNQARDTEANLKKTPAKSMDKGSTL